MKSCRATALWASMIVAAMISPGLAQVVDDFNRTSLGSNWTADTEYKIVSNTLDNTATTTGWTYLAVYNAVTNPYQVQFTWASTADASGINAGGIAMLLNSASTTANGMMIFRRDLTLEINPIVNGNVDRTVPVASIAASQPSPTKGSIVKIVFRTDATKAYFDYYVNGVLDGTLSYLRASYAAIPATYYAGVCLYGNMNNNIDDFTVTGQSLTLTSPNGGESWLAGSTHAITWNSSGFTGTIALDYSLDAGATWTAITGSATNSGTYSWTLPATTSANARVRVRDASDSNPLDASDANFTIAPQTESLTLLTPNGGESWEINAARNITWSSTGAIANVRIFYSADAGTNWSLVVTSTPNDGSYTWTTPGVTTTHGLIRITDALDGLPLDESNATFAILTLATLYVRDTSGQPGSTGNQVLVCLDNITPIRGLSFKLTDSPAYLTAMNILPVERAAEFTVTKSDNGTAVTIMVVSMTGTSIPPGSGPICQLSYDVSGTAPLGEFSSLDFGNVVVSDDSSRAVLPELMPGKFWFVKMGDLDNGGTIDLLDISRAADIVLGRPPAISENEIMSGDLDHDGDLDLYDLLNIWEIVY